MLTTWILPALVSRWIGQGRARISRRPVEGGKGALLAGEFLKIALDFTPGPFAAGLQSLDLDLGQRRDPR